MRGSETAPSGTDVILIPRFGDHRLGRWLMRRMRHPYYRMKLDEIGTFVWRRIDGRTSVASIGESMKKQFSEKVEPVYERLGKFVSQLDRAGVIQFVEDQGRGVRP